MEFKTKLLSQNVYKKKDAVAFLSNITLGSEKDAYPKNLTSALCSFELKRDNVYCYEKETISILSPRKTPILSSHKPASTAIYKLRRKDSSQLIASEKTKKKAGKSRSNDAPSKLRTNFVSVFQYYRNIVCRPKKVDQYFDYSPVQELFCSESLGGNKSSSYAVFPKKIQQEQPWTHSIPEIQQCQNPLLSVITLQEQKTSQVPSPNIISDIAFQKIKPIRQKLLDITLALDIELSTLSHAYVYLEKLIQKSILTKKNRKLIAAVKVNEHKSVCFKDLSEIIHQQLDIGSKDLKENEFSVFLDLDCNLYVPIEEFMPHLNQLLSITNYQSLQEYIGSESFYKIE